jgi:hypothetical protein
MNPLDPQEPHALIQFAICFIIACFFAAVLFGWAQ